MRTRRLCLIGLACLILSAPAAAAEKDTTEYFAVFLASKKIGHAVETIQTAGNKVTTSQTQVMTITRMETPVTIRMEQTSVETADGKPVSFKMTQTLSGQAQSLAGTIDNRGQLHVTIDAGGNTTRRTMTWPEGALLEHGFHLLTVKKGLKQGTKYSALQFSPPLLRAVEVGAEVGPTRNVDLLGRVVPLTEIKATVNVPGAAQETTLYVDRDGRGQKVVTAAMGMQIEVVACSKQFALSENDRVTDFVDRFLLPSPAPLGDLDKVKSITYTLTPTGGAKLNIPGTDNQTVRQEAGTFVVTVRPAAAAANVKFPYAGADKTALAALKPTRFVQSEDKKVVELARKAIGDAADATTAARRIEAFVEKYIQQKDFSVGYGSAAEVAVTRQGDCSEHAVLAAAMCRAVGIPAQVVTGLAHTQQFAGKTNVFGPHAWVQALIGEKWVGLDATSLKHGPGHIALLAGDGDLDEFFGIITTLGCFKITEVQVQR